MNSALGQDEMVVSVLKESLEKSESVTKGMVSNSQAENVREG